MEKFSFKDLLEREIILKDVNGSEQKIKIDTVEIPMIQRDYAQGRKTRSDTEVDAQRFVEAIFENLKVNREMEMDFIYGSISEEKTFLPLDGQQRLTTLWLLHWYVGKREKQTDLSFLENFTYETRTSSRDFCSALSKEADIDFDNSKDISSQIKNMSWFHAVYKKDPTINAMLSMIDSIHKQYKQRDCQNLFDNLNKLQFYPFVLNNFNLTDELYIKMNARGKPLTNFENFKADLIGYIEEKAEKAEEAEEAENWKKLLDFENGIAVKMDTTWTDIFWKKRAEDNRIDEIYFAFFNRYVLNEFCCSAKNAEKCESEKIFKFLYGKSGDDSQVSYSVFDNYKWISLELLNKISNVLDRVYRLDEAQLAILNKFDFIPTYEKDVSLSTLTQARRVKFFAISAYFANGDFEETSFMRWMRVANNLIDNADIDSVTDMISHIKLIDELSKGSHSIYEHLTAEKFSVQSKASEEQLQEEIAKAKLILNDKSKWEKRIENLENHGYFTGQIRFIFDWLGNEPKATKFDECSKVMKKLFGNADVSDEIGKNGNHCFQRALLCFDEYGNFGTWRGINYSFLLGKRDESYSWKKFLLDAERSQYLKSLVDKICNEYNCDVSVEILEKIINSCKSKIKNWRKFFIDYPDVWNYMEHKNIRWNNSKYKIDIVKRERCGVEVDHAELRSYCLYLDLKKQLSEYDTKFWERDNTCAYFDIINNDGKNIALDIYFDVEKSSEKESEDCYGIKVFERDNDGKKIKFENEDFEWNKKDKVYYGTEYYSKADVIKKIKEILNQLSQ